jgi:uroporphyrinogen-III synthase
VLASGSAAESWANAVAGRNPELNPPITVAIGPTTAERARKLGLKVCGVAADHSLEGLVDELERQFHAQSKI